LRDHPPHDFRIVILRDEGCHRRVDIPGQTALLRMPLAA
jgi:hypothetical protein